MLGGRSDADLPGRGDFADARWECRAEALARERGGQEPGWSIDYFAFPRGLYAEMPALGIGRVWWGLWLVWKAGEQGGEVGDDSGGVSAIHQYHGLAYPPQGVH